MNAPAHTPGLYAPLLPPRSTVRAKLTDAIAEMNRTPGTVTDETMARALERILAGQGLRIVPVEALSGEARRG
jgi:hypothetical protein